MDRPFGRKVLKADRGPDDVHAYVLGSRRRDHDAVGVRRAHAGISGELIRLPGPENLTQERSLLGYAHARSVRICLPGRFFTRSVKNQCIALGGLATRTQRG